MSIYNVYLGTPYECVGSYPQRPKVDYSPVRDLVEKFFQRALKLEGSGRTARVQYTRYPPALQTGELLIYLVPSPNHSIWVYDGIEEYKRMGVKTQTAIKQWASDTRTDFLFQTGSTINVRGKFLSEVWLSKSQSPRELAAVIFHEAMHNASAMAWTNKMHKDYGDLGSDDPRVWRHGNPASAEDYYRFVAKDLQAMAGWIKAGPPPQWTDGFVVYCRSQKACTTILDEVHGRTWRECH